MAFRLSVAAQNALVTDIVQMFAGTMGTGGTANLKIYSGTQPSSATCGSVGTINAGSYGTLLCQISNIGWSWTSGTSGTAVLAATAGYTGTAVSTGVAGWARMENVGSDGTCRIDGDAGLTGASVFVISNINISSSDVVTLTAADIYMS
jgi:hypothetical protein